MRAKCKEKREKQKATIQNRRQTCRKKIIIGNVKLMFMNQKGDEAKFKGAKIKPRKEKERRKRRCNEGEKRKDNRHNRCVRD